MIHRILTFIFGEPDQVRGPQKRQVSMYRWAAIKGRAYIHHFVGEDWGFHEHVRAFISFGLWGAYREQTRAGARDFHAPWIRKFPRGHYHRISVCGRSCWTFIVAIS